jgi:hypothetical protein
MKIRSGFVSNSSSSSFIIIGNSIGDKTLETYKKVFGNRDTLLISKEFGNNHFGWEHEKYAAFGDLVIFARIQAEYVKKTHPEWMAMLDKVLKDNLNVKEVVWEITTDWEKERDYCYIDHQSASSEGQNTEMFDSEDALTKFLFSDDSYIQGGNDNDDY